MHLAAGHSIPSFLAEYADTYEEVYDTAPAPVAMPHPHPTRKASGATKALSVQDRVLATIRALCAEALPSSDFARLLDANRVWRMRQCLPLLPPRTGEPATPEWTAALASQGPLTQGLGVGSAA